MVKEAGRKILGSAYLVAGGGEMLPAIKKFLRDFDIEVEKSADMYTREYLSFGVDDARTLRERAYSRAIRGGRRVFIIVTPVMTPDAQNALLKTLEEPPADAVFFFVVPAPEMMLATLRSRSHILKLESGQVGGMVDSHAFLAATTEKRIEMMKSLYERTEDDERDLRGAIFFLSNLEKALSSKIQDSGVREGVRALYRARKFLTDKGALQKPLLEQVALLVPRV